MLSKDEVVDIVNKISNLPNPEKNLKIKLNELEDKGLCCKVTSTYKKGSFYDVWIFHSAKCVVKVIKNGYYKEKYMQVFPSKKSVSSKFFLFPILNNRKRSIIVQDYVKTDYESQMKAYKIINSYLFEKNEEWKDAHTGNVGFFGNRAVIFDFYHPSLEN